MIGYQIWKECSALVNEYDPDETRVTIHYPCSDVYLDENKANEKLTELNVKPLPSSSSPISCYSKTLQYYIKRINIIS